MPLNPLIALSAAAPDINVAGMLTQARQATLAGQQVQAGQNQLNQTSAINNAYQQSLGPDGTLDRNKLYGLIAQNGAGSAVPTMTKTYAEADKAQAGAMGDAQKVQLGHIQMVGSLLNSVTDDASYQQALGAAHANGINIAGAPAQYDPNWVAQTKQQAQSVTDHLNQQDKDQQFALERKKFQYAQDNDAANRDVTLRGQDSTAATAVRGQDSTAATARYGQDLTAATETRGQNTRALDYDPKAGAIVNKLTGVGTPVLDPQGNAIAKPSANLTEGQANATGFAARATDANNILSKLEQSGTSNGGRITQALGGVPIIGGALAGAANSLGVNSDQQQSYQQAKTNFVTAILRKESGAAIGKDEYDTADKQYFPQPGDSPATIEQKARARDLTIQAIQAQAGPGAALIPGVITSTDSAYQAQPRPAPGAQQQAPQATPRASVQQRMQIAPGTTRQIGGKTYQNDGHGWLEVN